jgi:D-glycerate 3-kinase
MPAARPLLEVAAPFVDARLRAARVSPGAPPTPPLVLGVNGPQGAGKSTLVAALVERARRRGYAAVGVSIDDFYHTRADLDALAATHPDNPLLAARGYPGTHDVGLGAAVLAALCTAGAAGATESVVVPAYDKGAFGGRGERLPRERWRVVPRPLDVVFIEGWMLGFRPVAAETLSDARLAVPNAALGAYAAWHDHVHAWLVLEASGFEQIAAWRVEAEAHRRAAGGSAMGEHEVSEYIRRFEPAYATWGPTLLESIETRPALFARLDRSRLVESLQ